MQAKFSCAEEEAVLLRRANGLFENALRNGRGMAPYEVLQAWGRSLIDLSESNEGWRRSALVADAIAKFEKGYDSKPDSHGWINPIATDWDNAIHIQHSIHQEWR